MFGFFKARKAISDARNVVGTELHRQLAEALEQNESLATQKLSTAFTPGYIYWFVRLGFSVQGVDGGKIVDDQLRQVCDGVLPGKLYKIFESQLAALQVAKSMSNQAAPIPGTKVSPKQLVELFELGTLAAVHDARVLSSRPSNFKKYLLGQQVHAPDV